MNGTLGGVANEVLIAAGAGALVVALLLLLLWRRRSSGKAASRRAHEKAQQRDAPVDLGGTYEFGVTEFADHHSGERVAVGKVEGFVLFTEDVPDGISEGDVIRATVTSFNRNGTSADAIYEGRA